MITKNLEGKRTLDIFENFNVDYNLPKFKKEETESKYSDNVINMSGGVWTTAVGPMTMNGVSSTAPFNRDGRKSIIKGIYNKLKFKYNEWKAEEPEKVFARIFASKLSVNSIPERTVQFEKILQSAKDSGQTALYEQLKKSEEVIKLENILHATTFEKYISEDKLIEFSDLCKRGLRLDWVKNFNRIIPQRVIDEKLEADRLKIFDNYVVLHYDPENKSTKLTEEEIRRKKDPILFGVFAKSRRLYFIGDWKDELCDLTFDDLVDKLGKDALTL